MSPPILELRQVSCAREDSGAIHEVTLAFTAGSFNFIEGEASCGKNLLLRIAGLLEQPDSGDLLLQGRSLQTWPEDARAEIRSSSFGYLFTDPFLLPNFSVVENVAMPLFKISGVDPAEARRRTESMLAFVGLEQHLTEPATLLPRPAQQRISLARALANQPALLIVENIDEGWPPYEMEAFAALLRNSSERFGITVIATTSIAVPAAKDDRVIVLERGRVRSDSRLVAKLA